MGLILLTCSWFLPVSVSHFIVCLSIDTPLYWFGLGLLFTTAFSVYACFWPKFAYIHEFQSRTHVYREGSGKKQAKGKPIKGSVNGQTYYKMQPRNKEK